ncbi:enoyl-CoA hydratase/isomerase family protein [Streptomyces sp. SAS_275]|uniref:enoyl-CoA hydratase/isomerase family protein n=1 Tax=Streptomyces sp. SAS_275 TaxID=3412746 RepID=UPI00403C9479
MTAPTRFTVTESSDSLWRVTFRNPPINLIDPRMMIELKALLSRIEANDKLAVVVFDSSDPDYFLAHYDLDPNPDDLAAVPEGPTGFHPWLDILVRLSKVPAVTISSIRGRARGAGSEFALATDIRFASDAAVLAQMEVGFAAIPGGGPASRLPGLVGRGRSFEILLGGMDYDGRLAERYGYVNRCLPDAELDAFVDSFARRVSNFDLQALADIKHHINKATLPDDKDFPPQMDAFWRAVSRPALQSISTQLFERGLQQAGDVEKNLAAWVGRIAPSAPAQDADS